MSLISAEIGELRVMNQALIDGKIDTKVCLTRLKVYKATLEREKMIMDLHKLSTLKGISMSKLANTGLITPGERLPIFVTDFSGELVACPDQSKTITRNECFDFSGEVENTVSCQSCPNHKTTQRLLVPEMIHN